MIKRMFLSTLGRRIRELRIEKDLSQNDLAVLCEFEKASMSRIEAGKTNVTVFTLRRISTALGVPISEFFKD